MDTEKAKKLAQRLLKTTLSPLEKINAVNRTIEELMAQGYRVTCPVTGVPLRGVSLREGYIQYHLL